MLKGSTSFWLNTTLTSQRFPAQNFLGVLLIIPKWIVEIYTMFEILTNKLYLYLLYIFELKIENNRLYRFSFYWTEPSMKEQSFVTTLY